MEIKRILTLICLLLAPCIVKGQEEVYYDDDFVTASILQSDPGGVLYSLVGHVAIRMQCPTYDLDYVFSYESDDASRKVLAFLSGKLKMGLAAISTNEYLQGYSEEKRGVREYVLNLPIESKRELWRTLDNHVMEGMNLPYDYLERGCALSTLHMLNEGIQPLELEYGKWPEYFKSTRREITSLQMSRYSWTWAFLNLICNGSIDKVCPFEEKVIMPSDLIDVLSETKVDGKPIISEPIEVLPSEFTPSIPWFKPIHLAIIILLLTIICGILKKDYMAYVLLAIQTLLGMITLYLVCFSSLVCTEWSWLIIPFNPLPAILWKWRKFWSMPYSAICIIWSVGMLVSKHQLTDTTYIITTISLATSYVFMFLNAKIKRQ